MEAIRDIEPAGENEALTPLEEALELLPDELEYTKKQRRTLLIWRIVCVVGVTVALILAILRWFIGGWWLDWVDNKITAGEAQQQLAETEQQAQAVIGDFVAPPHDEAAVSGTPAVDEALGWANLDVQEGYRVHVCGILRADEDGSLPVWFASDADNTVWVKLRVVAEDGTRLGETGILYPGEYVERVQLSEEAESGTVTLQMLGYEPDTYYSAGSVGLSTELTVED